MSSSGRLTRKSQLTDYQYHGRALDTYNFLDFTMQTYEEKENHRLDTGILGDRASATSHGHPSHVHVGYEVGHPEFGQKTWVIQSTDNNCIPNFIRRWFLQYDNEDQVDLHSAMMLIILKPWRKLEDLKLPLQPW